MDIAEKLAQALRLARGYMSDAVDYGTPCAKRDAELVDDALAEYKAVRTQPACARDGSKVIAQFVAERVSMGRGDERYIGTADGSLGVTVRYGELGEVRNDLLWLIADAILAAAPQPARDH